MMNLNEKHNNVMRILDNGKSQKEIYDRFMKNISILALSNDEDNLKECLREIGRFEIFIESNFSNEETIQEYNTKLYLLYYSVKKLILKNSKERINSDKVYKYSK